MDSYLQKKAYFQSRRGLQELDLILLPFVQNNFVDLDHKMKLSYLTLLNEDDVMLLDWLLEKVVPPKKLSRIVNLVIKKIITNESK
ncbi:MAG: succinate dehydrogenase assembly factor 2 [SAR86 cluster bacterium]|jgi:antitoxin CptB|nr:succinate dehydrogenase assembly factor 2 [SAR86 cluster bacterium]